MLEKDSWSNASTGVFSSSPKSNSIIEASSIAFENTKSSRYVFESVKMDSNNNKICRNDTTPCEKTTAVEDNTFSDALGNITHTGNNLDFLDNTEDKDSSEFLYHGWPEIENFEDVDRMFRSCHSTFGLGISKEDDLDWFTSADNLGGSGDVVTSESEFPCPDLNPVDYISQNHDSSKGNFVNDFAMPKDSSWTSDEPDSYVSFMNGPAVANSEDRFIPKEQINGNKNQVKLQNQFIRKRKEHCSGNGSFIYTSNLPNEAMQLSPSYMHSNDSPSDITSVNLASSAAKSENHELQDDPQFPAAGSGEREKLRNRQGSLKNPTATVQASIVDPGLIGKQVQYSGEKSENHSDAEQASHVMQAELSSSHIQERSTMSLGMDDISQEEASFRQLQLVVEQLDLRTKICIRDSLYRLARSAEQRHNHANLKGSCVDERDASGAFMIGGTDNFMDMETGTNPIDRSVAHLLFHRPLESSSAVLVRGSVTSPSVVVENLVLSCEETASKMENNPEH